MTDSCGCPPVAGNAVCELPSQTIARPSRATKTCPQCHQSGKPVQGQTVKAMLLVSLRDVRDGDYLFCKIKTCPVVYFTLNGEQVFTVDQVRERVYQKEPEADEVFVCYCFRHTIGEVRQASPAERTTIVDDINAGIQAEQCACDLRNPQGSCCLGNARGLIKRLEVATTATVH
ncbi:MAG: copper chaperone Copz family protein [Chloroflexi bacterium]|nr:copper chaperone Copz family protein [Chloroflexota bacterium]